MGPGKTYQTKFNLFLFFLNCKPAQIMVLSFAGVIVIGTLLLMLPLATTSGVNTSLVDALFTATSATCVTGLIVKDTAGYFSIFGQLVILFLIQIGGLGIMTFSVFLALFLKKPVGIKQEVLMQDLLDYNTLSDIKHYILEIIKMTLFFELCGAILLFIAWGENISSIPTRLYYAVFHSISAFCNAGFSTFSDSLIRFNNDTLTNIIICSLIVAGGLGFMVIKDLQENIRNKFINTDTRKIRLKTQSKIVLFTSGLLILGGALIFYLLEKDNSLSSVNMQSAALISVFQSITARTAGFNTCDIAKLSSATLFFMIALMFIGGSPGSTAGGVKTTTVSVLWATVLSGIKKKENVEIFRRTIPYDVIQKAIIIFLISLLLVFIFITLLLYFEKKSLTGIFFEAVSAFGTVGLSTGITGILSSIGKILITLLMFIGRIGPLTMGYAFLKLKRPAKYMYAEENVSIG